jgi:outer membrane protein assembly factor BamB/adenine/guanine phosphoribosyltransferase-like PRPP-binding protein
MTPSDHKHALKVLIEKRAFVRSGTTQIYRRDRGLSQWIFDFRSILMEQEAMEHLAALFWDSFPAEDHIQIGCIESAGIPLATALVAHAGKYGKHASGFYIRKSRKKDGLAKMIEGTFDPNQSVVLVDDILNSGKSMRRQIEVVRAAGGVIKAFWTIMQFRDDAFYDSDGRALERRSLFTLNDFEETLGLRNITRPAVLPRAQYEVLWKFESKDPGFVHVVPKSDPAIDDDTVYMGSDSGIFWAIDQTDGSVRWQYRTGFHPKGKGIFSSPALYKDTVYFGAYDGNVYALNRKTGKRTWIYYEADWVGSSPAIAADLGLLFIGLEFGLFKRRGGIAAIHLESGKKLWDYRMPCFSHSTPLYIHKHREVVIGSNDGSVYLFNATNGDLIWKFETGTLTEEELAAGFSQYDIKESFAYDEKRDIIIFGNKAGRLYSIARSTGTLVSTFEAAFGFYSTPLIHDDSVYLSSLDKNMYCLDLGTFSEKWRWNAGARVFASPTLVNGHLFIGANTGRLTELDPATGAELSYMTFTERITNRIAYNSATERFFVPTYANEVYCIKKLS